MHLPAVPPPIRDELSGMNSSTSPCIAGNVIVHVYPPVAGMERVTVTDSSSDTILDIAFTAVCMSLAVIVLDRATLTPVAKR